MLSARGQAVASVCAGVSASHSGISASRRLVGSGSEAVIGLALVGDVFALVETCRLPFQVVLGSLEHSAIQSGFR